LFSANFGETFLYISSAVEVALRINCGSSNRLLFSFAISVKFINCCNFAVDSLVVGPSLVYPETTAFANSVLNSGGNVTGVITEHLLPIEGHTALGDLRIVKTMHQRKSMMYELSNGFAILPGGIGTLDEFFEILTWARLKFHSKPIGILNTALYYNKLLNFLHHIADEGFLKRDQLDLIFIADTPDKLLQGLKERL
jgi:uncharacterized protein (TIGR00730 family)